MTSALNPEASISLSRLIKEEDFTLEALTESLLGETFLKIIDNTTGEEIKVPFKFADAIVRQGHGLLTESEEQKTEARMLAFHPTKHFDNLIPATPGFNHRLVIDGTSATSEGTPILSWHAGDNGGRFAVKGYGKSQIETTVNEQGWRLSLAGAEGVGLAFAKWNDLEGITKLVEAMGNQSNLSVIVALTNPQEAAILAARKTAKDLYAARTLPAIKAPIIRKLINDNGLIGRGNSSRGRLTILSLNVEGTEIPVALAVERPMVPIFTEVISDRKNSGYFDRVRKAEEIAKLEWEIKFRELVAELGNGWRFIDLPLPANRGDSVGRSSKFPTLWLTRINNVTWDSIEPAVKMATKTFRLSGVRF